MPVPITQLLVAERSPGPPPHVPASGWCHSVTCFQELCFNLCVCLLAKLFIPRPQGGHLNRHLVLALTHLS